MTDGFRVEAIGRVRSPLHSLEEAPKQGCDGQVKGELHLEERFREALMGLRPGQRIVILYWMHQADRGCLQVHPRGDRSRPLRGVFATRSPDRPNPIALQTVEILDIQDTVLTVLGLDALDGTPLLDIKSELREG